MKTPAIWAKDLSKDYDGQTVVDNLNLNVPEGTIYGFIGPSGSGKTTSLRMLTGVTPRTRGEVELLGRKPENLRRKDREAIGYTPQLGVLYPHLSVMDNLLFMASLYGMFLPRRRIKQLLVALKLEDAANKKLRDTSGGMQRRVALAGAMLHNPRLLFLDEPTAGLDPMLRKDLWAHFEDLKSQGRTLFITTQIVSEAAVCDKVGLLVDGQIVSENTPGGLRVEAFGGHVIDMHLSAKVPQVLFQILHQHPLANAVHHVPNNAKAIRVTVDKVETDVPILRHVVASTGVDVILSERYLAPFDDVFVALLERYRARRQALQLEAVSSADESVPSMSGNKIGSVSDDADADDIVDKVAGQPDNSTNADSKKDDPTVEDSAARTQQGLPIQDALEVVEFADQPDEKPSKDQQLQAAQDEAAKELAKIQAELKEAQLALAEAEQKAAEQAEKVAAEKIAAEKAAAEQAEKLAAEKEAAEAAEQAEQLAEEKAAAEQAEKLAAEKEAAEAAKEAEQLAAKQAKEAQAAAKQAAVEQAKADAKAKEEAEQAKQLAEEAAKVAPAEQAKAAALQRAQEAAAKRKALAEEAEQQAKAREEAQAKRVAEEEAKAKAAAQEEAQRLAKAQAEAEAKAQAEAEAKAQAEAEAKAQAEAKAKAQAEAKAIAEAEAKAQGATPAKREVTPVFNGTTLKPFTFANSKNQDPNSPAAKRAALFQNLNGTSGFLTTRKDANVKPADASTVGKTQPSKYLTPAQAKAKARAGQEHLADSKAVVDSQENSTTLDDIASSKPETADKLMATNFLFSPYAKTREFFERLTSRDKTPKSEDVNDDSTQSQIAVEKAVPDHQTER